MSSILIIDDSPEDRELFSSMLKEAEPDVTVLACKDGRDGVGRARQQALDCVLLDLRLDGEDGLEVLAQLQEVRPNLPVIVFTGQGSEQAATDAFVAGAAYYLPKRDLTGKALWTAVRRVIHRASLDRELKSKRDAMERSNRLDAIGQLAAGIAHDFNNQLGALRYCIELLKSAAVTERSKEQIHAALKIVDESASLATRMIALSRQGDLLARDVNLNDTFADLRALPSASVSGQVMLDVDIPDPDVSVVCDPGQLLNALLNLVLNADDAIAAKGEIGTIKVLVAREDNKVRIVVKDDGIGMEEEILSKCADPFFTTKTDRNGTGLGLAMVQSLANDSGGELLLHSTPGVGTEAALLLPTGTRATTASSSSIEQASHSVRTARILLVEDAALLAALTKEVLETEGFFVELAQDGSRALEILSSGFVPDLVLTDIRMPGMNGFELADEVARRSPEMKFIYVTGYADSSEQKKQELHGPILQKPVEPRDLISTINTVLAGS